ncbi:MAG: hypothetical protein ACOX41_01250 [Anaerovoracaceae bacterium]|jgi:hypothetical protein
MNIKYWSDLVGVDITKIDKKYDSNINDSAKKFRLLSAKKIFSAKNLKWEI